MSFVVGCHANDAATDAGDAVVCDVNCESGCYMMGAGKCDSACAAGYSLNTNDYTCIGLSYSSFLCSEG